MLVDTEKGFTDDEVTQLAAYVQEDGLGVVVFADWYSDNMKRKVEFFDDNTHSLWRPLTGGANVPALNRLLTPYGIGLSTTRVVTGVSPPPHHDAAGHSPDNISR